MMNNNKEKILSQNCNVHRLTNRIVTLREKKNEKEKLKERKKELLLAFAIHRLQNSKMMVRMTMNVTPILYHTCDDHERVSMEAWN